MSRVLETIFGRLRAILQQHEGTLQLTEDTASHYCLEGTVGPATLRAWRGKSKKPTIPVAWVKIGKSYVSFHLMGMYGNATLRGGMSKELQARMQGKTCFNFKTHDEALFKELEHLTPESLAAIRRNGFIADQ
jgi:hypothetical protein